MFMSQLFILQNVTLVSDSYYMLNSTINKGLLYKVRSFIIIYIYVSYVTTNFEFVKLVNYHICATCIFVSSCYHILYHTVIMLHLLTYLQILFVSLLDIVHSYLISSIILHQVNFYTVIHALSSNAFHTFSLDNLYVK